MRISSRRVLTRTIIVTAMVALVVVVLMSISRRNRENWQTTAKSAPPPETQKRATPAPSTSPVVNAASSQATATPTDEVVGRREWNELTVQAKDAASQGSGASRTFVLQLFAALDKLMPDERVAVVYDFFASGLDARFGGAFTVGAGGFLQDWPTLRVALLDYLSQRDGTAARALAEKLLHTRPEEAGEWTLALRELVRGRVASEWPEMITTRVHEFVDDPAWGGDPSRSWLEGFDIVVAGRSPEFLGDLSTIAGGGRSRAARFAAFLAADRLALAAPEQTLAALNARPDLFANETNVRAGLFARADVRRPAQLRELENYLLRTDVGEAERRSFADLFPHYDLAVSQNVLTPPASRTMSDMLDHDRAAVTHLEQWLTGPRFAPWHENLREVRRRLAEQLALARP